jgi:hypothetical protein
MHSNGPLHQVDIYNTRHPKITNCDFTSCLIHIQLGKHQISIYGSFLYGLIGSPTSTRRAVDMYNTRHSKITNCGFPSYIIHTHTTRKTPNIYLWKLLLIWSHRLIHTHQESSRYVQHQASKNHQLWFPTMFHTHTGKGTQKSNL